MTDKYNTIRPIGYVVSDFKEKFGIPRQSGRSPSSTAQIIFYKEFCSPEAFRGIENYSHLWVLFDFSLAHREKQRATVRPPRFGGNMHVGVFATRSPFRPNNIGLSSVKLEKTEYTEKTGTVLTVSGADMLDGTPVYDIKPYLPFTDCHTEATSGSVTGEGIPKLDVVFANGAENLIPKEKITALTECLADDPRPSYHNDDRTYSMKFADLDVHFSVSGNIVTVIGADKIKT